MRVKVELFGTLRDFRPPGSKESAFEQDVSADATVADVLRRLEIPENKPLIALVNALHAENDQELAEGDLIHFMAHIAGG